MKPLGITRSVRTKYSFYSKLPETIGQHVFNYGSFLRNLKVTDLNNLQICDCEINLTDAHQGHKLGGNLENICSGNLLRLLQKGTKYRTNNHTTVTDAVKAALEDFQVVLLDAVKRKYISKEQLPEAYSRGLQILQQNVQRAKLYKKDKDIRNRREEEMKGLKELRHLQKSYIFVPIDKAASNIGYVCKSYYVQLLCKELGITVGDEIGIHGNDTYVKSEEEETRVFARHKGATKAFTSTELEISQKVTAKLWMTLKLHKNPIGKRFIAGARNCSIRPITDTLTQLLTGIKEHWDRYTKAAEDRSGIHYGWSIKNSEAFVNKLRRGGIRQNGKIHIADFSTLYTALEHDVVKLHMHELIDKMFQNNGAKYLALGGSKTYYHSDENRNLKRSYTSTKLKNMVDYVVDNSYVVFAGVLFHQIKGLPMGSASGPVIADLVLSHMEFKFLSQGDNKKDAIRLKHTVRYLDDICSMGSNALIEVAHKIYPPSLPLNFDDTTEGKGHFLDLHIDATTLNYGIYDKRRDFPFKVNRFPDRASNQPEHMGLNVYYSQLLRFARLTRDPEDFHRNVQFLDSALQEKGFDYNEVERKKIQVARRYKPLFNRLNFNR